MFFTGRVFDITKVVIHRLHLLFLGLDRQLTAFRHFQVLTKFLPTSLFFAYQVGLLSLEPEVARPSVAVEAFHRILYGNISHNLSDVPEELLYNCRISYMRALGLTGSYEDALIEADRLIQMYPFDFEVLAYMSDAKNKILLDVGLDLTNDVATSNITYNMDAMDAVEGLYDRIESLGMYV